MKAKKRQSKKVKGKARPEPRKRLVKIANPELRSIIESGNVEEFYFLIKALDSSATAEILKGKNQESKTKLSKILSESKTPQELLSRIEEELMNDLKSDNEKIRQDISQIRKKGADVYDESLREMSIPLKIRMFKATGKKEDFIKVKKIIFEIEESLKEKLNLIQKKN